MPDYEITWEEPPAEAFEWRAQSSGTWNARLLPLTERTGEWARVASGFASLIRARDVAARLRRMQYKIPPGRWEFVHHDTAVYARFLGPEPDIRATKKPTEN